MWYSTKEDELLDALSLMQASTIPRSPFGAMDAVYTILHFRVLERFCLTGTVAPFPAMKPGNLTSGCRKIFVSLPASFPMVTLVDN